ncbi:MAG: tetratricopeptide repeat protein [Bacteroidetes bacterium]|nr:tetratricopeptide repeat protein [Bacteroidota bacterium]
MRYIILIGMLSFSLSLFSQESKLAQQYFKDGEYEKASVLFESLYKKNNGNEYYFDRYVDCLIALEQYSTCEKTIKKQLKKFPKNVLLYVTYGKLFERQYQDEKAAEQYQAAVKELPGDRFTITKLANSFRANMKYKLAIQVYEKGSKLLRDDVIFAYNLGDLYRVKGDTPKMIENYLNSLAANPARLNTLKTLFQRYLLSDDDYDELQTQLYARLQENRDAIYYPEMLTWLFIQKKDYKSALRQAKALDRRLKENGGRIFRLAEIAANDFDYKTAIEGYEYIVEEKGPVSTFYIEAKLQSLNCKRNQIVEGFEYTIEDLTELEAEYETFLNEFGHSQATAGIIAELANLEAFYLNNLDKAISLLSEMISYPGINGNIQARGKLSLADFYLMQGEIWEATLLYSQVDKAFKDDILGHEARFRNAKLSYYAADFHWAQAQFDVLKASTSKLIANDALDLSVFIMDNLGLDTTATALKIYSEADLFLFQNRFDEAFQKLDSLKAQFDDHSLEDDLLYMQAKIYLKKREYSKAADKFQTIIEEHTDGIRADNSMFELASIYENQLNDIEKAKELYERIFIEFSGSTFAVEARKRFRVLRGDNVQ